MSRMLIVLIVVIVSARVTAQSSDVAHTQIRPQPTATLPIKPQVWTDQEMMEMGLNEADITHYRHQRETIKGQWWGHVSPVEFLLYASEDKNDRDRYARVYLSSNFPKAKAERDAMVSMFEMARDIYAEEHAVSPDVKQDETRPALFVDIRCQHCRTPVAELIGVSSVKVDVYFTGLPDSDDPVIRQNAMVGWAKSLKLKPEQITLNEDNGIYEKLNNRPLVDYHLMRP